MLLEADNVARGRQCCCMQTMLLHADNTLATLKTLSHSQSTSLGMSPATDTRTNSCWRTWSSDWCLAGGTVESHVAGTLPTIVALLWDRIENITSKHLQSCFSLHISGILSDSIHARSILYRLPRLLCTIYLYTNSANSFLFSSAFLKVMMSHRKLYESRWEAIFSNAQCKVSFILPAQHINFILLHLQNIAELYVGSWQYLHI